MANQKISNLKSLNAESIAQEDLIPIVDVSSPTSVGGELKRISVNQLVGHVVDLSLVEIQNTANGKYDKTGGPISGNVSIAGSLGVIGNSEFQGQVNVPLIPISPTAATSKQYVDSSVSGSFNIGNILNGISPTLSLKYDKVGGPITGNVSIVGSLSVQGTSSFANNINVPSTPVSSTHATSKAYVDNLVAPLSNITSTVLQLVYPTGSIYISTLNTSPATLFGFGTWVAFGTGRTLVGFDAADSDFNTSEKVGGSKTHTLTISELPSHSHPVDAPLTTTNSNGAHTHAYTATRQERVGRGSNIIILGVAEPFQSAGPAGANLTTNGEHTHTFKIPIFDSGAAGGGAPHNNLQPYITVYMWKRTA